MLAGAGRAPGRAAAGGCASCCSSILENLGKLRPVEVFTLISDLSDPNMSALLGSLKNAALGNFRRFSYSKNVFC